MRPCAVSKARTPMSLSTIFRFQRTGRLPPDASPLSMSASNSPATGDPSEGGRDDNLALILACGALTMILGVQLMLPPSAPPAEPPGLAPRRQRPVMVPPVPEYAAILSSPIFAPDRRPGPAEDGASDSTGASL